jgi:hypothetical protein
LSLSLTVSVPATPGVEEVTVKDEDVPEWEAVNPTEYVV